MVSTRLNHAKQQSVSVLHFGLYRITILICFYAEFENLAFLGSWDKSWWLVKAQSGSRTNVNPSF